MAGMDSMSSRSEICSRLKSLEVGAQNQNGPTQGKSYGNGMSGGSTKQPYGKHDKTGTNPKMSKMK